MSKYRASIMKDNVEKDLSSKVYKWQQAKKTGVPANVLASAKAVAEASAELVKIYEELAAE